MKTNLYKEQFKKSVNFSKDFNERTLDNLNALIDEKEAFQNTKKQGNIIRLARRFSAVAAVLAIALIGVFVTSHNLSKPQPNAPVSAVSTPSYNNSHMQADTDSDETLSSESMSATNENANSDIHGNGEEVTSSQDTYSAIYDSEFTDTAIPADSEADTPVSDRNDSSTTDGEIESNDSGITEDIESEPQESAPRKHNYYYTVDNGNVTLSDGLPSQPNVNISEGTEIALEIYLKSNTPVAAINGSVYYDSSCLTLAEKSEEGYMVDFKGLGVYGIDSVTGWGESEISEYVKVCCNTDTNGILKWDCADLSTGIDFSRSLSLIKVTFVATEDINCNYNELMNLMGFSYGELFDLNYNAISKDDLTGRIVLEIG